MPPSQNPKEGDEILLEEIYKVPYPIVLDIGAGDGKWGSLIDKERIKSICALEVWGPHAAKLMDSYAYDSVIQDDMLNTDRIAYNSFNVIIFGDVLEHVEKDKGIGLIKFLKANTKAIILLTIPISLCIQDGWVYGNPYETHKAQWTYEELISLGFECLHRGFNPNGLVEIGTYKMRCNNGKETIDI